MKGANVKTLTKYLEEGASILKGLYYIKWSVQAKMEVYANLEEAAM